MIETTETTELETDESENQDESGLESEDQSEDNPEDESESESEDDPEDESEFQEAPDRLSENAAVALCCRAWHITMDNELARLQKGESDYEAKKQANEAFLAAMPPLSGYQNICDFIACATQAYMWEILRQKQVEHFLAAAKLALGALRFEPKQDGFERRGPGRPRKDAATMENK